MLGEMDSRGQSCYILLITLESVPVGPRSEDRWPCGFSGKPSGNINRSLFYSVLFSDVPLFMWSLSSCIHRESDFVCPFFIALVLQVVITFLHWWLGVGELILSHPHCTNELWGSQKCVSVFVLARVSVWVCVREGYERRSGENERYGEGGISYLLKYSRCTRRRVAREWHHGKAGCMSDQSQRSVQRHCFDRGVYNEEFIGRIYSVYIGYKQWTQISR